MVNSTKVIEGHGFGLVLMKLVEHIEHLKEHTQRMEGLLASWNQWQEQVYIFKMFIQFKPKKHTYSIVIYSLHLYILFLITYFTYLKLLRCYTQFKTNYVMNYSNIVFIDYKIAKFYY